MEIPRWGFAAFVVGALAVGGTVGALAAQAASGDGSDSDRLERANAKLSARLEGAKDDIGSAEDAVIEADDAAAEAEALVEQLQVSNGALEQRVSDLEASLADARATPPTSPPTSPPVPIVFGPGIYEVGVDMPAGVYRTTNIDCYHGKFQTPTGGVLTGGFGYGPAEVTVDSPWFKIDTTPNAPPGAECSFTKVG